MNVTEIAHTHSIKTGIWLGYLNILLCQGIEMRMYGKAKVCSLSSRVLFHNLMGGLLYLILILILILVYNNRIVRVNDQLLHLIIKARKNLSGKDIAYILFSEPW